MKNKNNISTYIYTLGIVIILISFTSLDKIKSIKSECFSMIWNVKIMKRSWVYLNQDDGKIYKQNSDITDGDKLKMPINNWDANYTDEKTKLKFATPNKTNASFKFVTLGYKVSDQNKLVGFDFKILNNNKKNEEPFIFRILNNSQKEDNKAMGTLREVGFVFDNWPQYWSENNNWAGGEHSFSGNYNIKDLDKLIVRFKYRLVDFDAPLNKKMVKEKWLGSYVTCDLRFNEYDESGKMTDKYLIGVVFSNPLNVDYNDNRNDDILYGLGGKVTNPNEKQVLLLHGNKVGVKEINNLNNKNEFQIVEIDFKPLINKYIEFNEGNRNIITGLDIYSATRGSNLTFDIQNIEVIGCK